MKVHLKIVKSKIYRSVLSQVFESSDVEFELSRFCELTEAGPKHNQVITRDACRYSDQTLFNIIYTIFLKTETIRTIYSIPEK